MMAGEEKNIHTKEHRKQALDMLAAAMSVVIQTYDIYLSAEIINEAGEKYGRLFVEDLLMELTESAYSLDVSKLAKDVFIKRAMLSMTVPLPASWMSTRN